MTLGGVDSGCHNSPNVCARAEAASNLLEEKGFDLNGRHALL